MRRKVSHLLALVVISALAIGLLAGPADAKTSRLSAKQKAHIRAQLRKQIKKHPMMITRKSFLKKASLVNFTLPITVKLRSSGNGTPLSATSNPNSALIDLGASLGTREIGLGGSLAGEIQFHDSFDGGALGNVDLVLNPGSKFLTSTSIPLLWNQNVTGAGKFWDLGLATGNAAEAGCAGFTGNSNLNWDVPNYSAADPFANSPGVPVFDITGQIPTLGNYIPINPGIDSTSNLTASNVPNNINNLGTNTTPFPSAISGFNQPPNLQDTVLRTAPLKLQVATPGTTGPATGGPDGTQVTTFGKSGGQANLFGSIPGKSYGIDVTVSLTTQINSILRAVDVDAQRVREGAAWPAALFDCRQAITGSVPNAIPDVHLKGNLKISPAITPSGQLRIAKASLSSLAEPYPTHIALAACLSPYSVLAAQNGNSTDTLSYPVPAHTSGYGVYTTSELPADTSTYSRVGSASNPDFSAAGSCDSTQTKLTQDAGFAGLPLAQSANGYSSFSTSTDGSKVSVAGDLTVTDVEADILIGDAP